MDILAQAQGGAQSKAKDDVLAKAMFEGTQQFRKKLKLPEVGEYGESKKEEALESSYYTFIGEEPGKHYFLRYVQDVHPIHGNFLLQCNRYKHSVHEKRAIAEQCCNDFMAVVTDVYSGEDIDALVDAYDAGTKAQPKPGKKSRRQEEKGRKMNEAKEILETTQNKLQSRTPPDLLEEMANVLMDGCDDYWPSFKKSKWLLQYCQARQMEHDRVVEDDFHMFRVLGVGGFGAVHAAVKRDTGALLAIKRMDKKLIKHKNRYKSCFTEAACLQQMSSSFVCGLHYCFQTKDDVCLVLDLLHGGTLSFLLHQKKRVSEKYVCFFTACIIEAYEALHTNLYVYRDMKPANVLIKDNGYAVLIDFGLAAKLDTALKGKCGTRGYWSPEMVKGDQYLYSGDWWSLGVTLVELLTGKKPFKKKFQKYKNTDDKVKLCDSGEVTDVIEEKNIEQKLGGAKEIDDDGRDSNDEETDDEEEGGGGDAEQKNKRRSSVRVIGGFDRTVDSVVETDAAIEFLDACIKTNDKLAPFGAGNTDLEGGMERLVRISSVVTFSADDEIIKPSEFATFFFIVLEGAVLSEDGTEHGLGSIVGYEGLFKDNFHRASKVTGGPAGGTVALMLYSELGRATLFDEQLLAVIKQVLCEVGGGDVPNMEAAIAEFGDQEDTHPEEAFIARQKHTAKAEDAAALEAKQKELSASKQRDQKIYLTQEVWAKKDHISRECQKFVKGLLTRDVNKRLGCGPNNFENLKGHEWFSENGPLKSNSQGLDWERLEAGTKTAPFIPKKEVNAKDESKMKTFNTAGMKKLNKEDQEKWNDWDFTNADYFKTEMAGYLYEQWGLTDAKRGRAGGGGGGGCCEIS